jgi:hypothetical protein
MSADKPFIDQMSDMAKDARASLPYGDARDRPNFSMQGVGESVQGIGESMQDMKTGMMDSISDFSKKSVTDASSEFLDSNSLLAKFSFIILVLVVFMVALKLLMSFVGYLFTPTTNPYLVKGMLNGNKTTTITQDPSKIGSIEVLRSNDRNKGIEFTYATWLLLHEPNDTKCQNIFVKGNNMFDASYSLTNGPGMYVTAVTDASGMMTYTLDVLMDTIDSNTFEKVTVPNIPIKKWVNIAVRIQNLTLDVYVNGTIAKRLNLTKLPKQNSSDVIVCGNGGFTGSLSNLRYYAYALSVFEINNIVRGGPSLTSSSLSSDSIAVSGTSTYLANSWYSSNY